MSEALPDENPHDTGPTGDVVIDVRGLVKRYGRRTAVDGLELQVGAGEVFGFLGPNGAGKTTTVRMLLGLARPSAGHGRLLGRPLGDPEARRRVGYLPENVHFPGWFTGMGFLHYHGALYGLSRREVDARARDALERLGLAGRGQDRLRGYSHGMLQRLGLAQALLNRPRLIFLDEPTSALDPRGRREVRELLEELRDQGTTVFLNSHLLSEVERTCDRVAIVADGRTRYLGPTHPDEHALRELDVRLEDAPDDLSAVLAGVATVRWRRGDTARLALSAPDAAPDVARRLLDAGVRLHALTPVRRELEDLFLELTGAPAVGKGNGSAAQAEPERDNARHEDAGGDGVGVGGDGAGPDGPGRAGPGHDGAGGGPARRHAVPHDGADDRTEVPS
ncbi:MAG: ABC transporter ATP-binding protein [Deinococcales bacterium]